MNRDRLEPLAHAIARRMAASENRGDVATYIPELARVDRALFALAIALPGDETIETGDGGVSFSIQSVSKVFTLALALDRLGADLWRKVGREPSGDPFNSIVQLEHECGKPRNPLINAGALAVADALLDAHEGDVERALEAILGLVRALAGSDAPHVDENVARSELAHADRNRALACFMAAHGVLTRPVEDVLELYVRHCAIAMNAVDLARAGRAFAHDGAIDGVPFMPRERAWRIASLMLTCGHYDGSGDFAFRVGLPGKSGVGGAILAIAPGRASIAAFSPGLNAIGNSELGSRALEELAVAAGWSVFAA